jgi:hypothetical protein
LGTLYHLKNHVLRAAAVGGAGRLVCGEHADRAADSAWDADGRGGGCLPAGGAGGERRSDELLDLLVCGAGAVDGARGVDGDLASAGGVHGGVGPGAGVGRRAVFVLGKSRTRHPGMHLRVWEGWHGVEDGAYRWTAPKFGLEVTLEEPAREFALQFFVPEAVVAGGRVRVACRIDGLAAGAITCDRADGMESRGRFPMREMTQRLEFTVESRVSAGRGMRGSWESACRWWKSRFGCRDSVRRRRCVRGSN